MMFFDSSPGSWDTDVAYTPTRTLNRWTGFIQNSATTKLRLTLEINNLEDLLLDSSLFELLSLIDAQLQIKDVNNGMRIKDHHKWN